MLKSSLQLRIGQSLTMTPQLQQTIKLLQFSTLELQNQIQEMLEQNPLLDTEESDEQTPSQPDATQEIKLDDEPARLDENQTIPDELPLDTRWDEIYQSLPSRSHASEEQQTSLLENRSGAEDNLREHLLFQLDLLNLSETDYSIAEILIENINDDGYLSDSIENIHAGFPEKLDIEIDEVQAVQNLVMHFDPIGAGASNLQENLLAQLDQINDNSDTTIDAREIITHHIETLGKQNLAELLRKTKLSESRLDAAISLIRSLNPRPGSQIGSGEIQYIAPDIYVTRTGDRWIASLNPEIAPKLRLHPLYSSMVKRGDRSKENQYLRENLQEARWFIKSLQSRNDTILRVAQAIVARQQAFFDQGEVGMHPLILRTIADELELHESTISRVTNQKYMLTPQGLLEFKYFFSAQLDTTDGGNTSATAIRALIKQLIDEENPQKPLSDNKIRSILVDDKGVNVARRTVAKYREGMQIPPSNERKRIA
ncbi:MAG TPA: RNA polymerase factor sigma-54 [Chromatiales bacterium]|nr:RNA polymerase factor sigma-54 [Thiotrichales bacterium]HIP69597.1 RNA polymerase factor sigma-54 [Chromatiales bacterium]